MADRSLSSDDVAFGRAILLATDALGMQAEGAFWLYDGNDKKWEYFLITSLFNTIGPHEIYMRLNRALEKKLSERETKNFHIFTGAPTERLVRLVRDALSTEPYASEPRECAIVLNSKEARVVVYRMAAPADEPTVRRAKVRFRRLSNELIAA